MFGERLQKHPESLLEKIPQHFSNIHRAGLMLFASGLLHVGAYQEYLSAPKQIAELKMAAKAAKSDLETAAWLAKDLQLKAAQTYRQETAFEMFPRVERDILREFDSGKARVLSILYAIGYEEYFVEGVPMETIEKGSRNYDELLIKLRAMRQAQENPAQVTDEVLNSILAAQGEYNENQPSAFVLFAGEGGNCQARAKAIAMLLDDLFPEYRGSNWIKIEVYRGYTDSTGKKHPGHVRVILDIPGEDHYNVMEGKGVYSSPIQEDRVTRVEAHDVFVRGSAAAMGIVEGGVADNDYSPRRLGILYPDSPVRYLGKENGEGQWWPGISAPPVPAVPKGQKYYGLASGVDILDEAITDEQVEKLVALKKENAELPHRFEEFLQSHKGEGVEKTESVAITATGRVGIAKIIILPLSASQETRKQTETFVAELRKVRPDANFKILYGITAPDQKIAPLSDPDSEYIFLIPPTPELIAQYPVLPQKSRVIVKNLKTTLQERGVDPYNFSLTICDPVTSLEDLRVLNAFAGDTTNFHPHVNYVFDLPEEILEIPLSGYTSVYLQHPNTLEGKTLFPEGGRADVNFIHGAVPSVHMSDAADVKFTADLSEYEQNSLILGYGTEFSVSGWDVIEFVGPMEVQEGWKIDGPDDAYTDLRFDSGVSFGPGAFIGVQKDLSLHVKSSWVENIDPHIFDGLQKEIHIVAMSEDPKAPSFYTDTDAIEKRIRAEVQFPPTVTMTVGNDWEHKYLKIIPKATEEQKGDVK